MYNTALMNRVKEVASSFNATRDSVAEAILAWALDRGDFDPKLLANQFTTIKPKGRKPLNALSQAELDVEIAKLEALKAAKATQGATTAAQAATPVASEPVVATTVAATRRNRNRR